jgi:tRNA modification GTPase
MSYDAEDTIVAIASAPGGAARGIVRISGPATEPSLAACWSSDDGVPLAKLRQHLRIAGTLHVTVGGRVKPVEVPGHLYFWPDDRSYTRQPSAELHLPGSPALLSAAVDELCRHGVRPAHPGEFTLRAFLSGRLDLAQAEAVIGVVNARSAADLDESLDQLAGGFSQPLRTLREELLAVLAELEAGLDFAEEPIEFIASAELSARLAHARRLVAEAIAQLATRQRPGELPRVVLAGPPNAGKSSLFNTLAARYGQPTAPRSIESPTPGATRDFVSATLELDGVACELVDVAGDDATADRDIAGAAQQLAAGRRRAADLCLLCVDATAVGDLTLGADERQFPVVTKLDLAIAPPGVAACSSATGAGIEALAAEIRRRLATQTGDGRGGSATAARSAGSLREAERALAAAANLVGADSEELIAAEIRLGLTAVGEVVGAVCADDVLDRVFSQFCIGK